MTVLSPIPFSLYTNDCTSADQSVKLQLSSHDTFVQDLDMSADGLWTDWSIAAVNITWSLTQSWFYDSPKTPRNTELYPFYDVTCK